MEQERLERERQEQERQRQEQVAQRVRGVIDGIVANGRSDLGDFVAINVHDANDDPLSGDVADGIVVNIMGAIDSLKGERNGTLAASMEVDAISGKRGLQQLIAGIINGAVKGLQVSSDYEAQQDVLINPWMATLN